MLDHCADDLSGKRIGMYSYGSGSVAEFFSGIISERYRAMLSSDENRKMLSNRIEISFEEYQSFCKNKDIDLSSNAYENIGSVKLVDIKDGYRTYEGVIHAISRHTIRTVKNSR